MKSHVRTFLTAIAAPFALALVQGCGSASMSVGSASTPAAENPAPPPAAEPKKEEPAIKAVGHLSVEKDEIKIPGKINFDNDKATIRADPPTAEILTEMAELLKENPGVTRLRIEGYTDDKGKPEYNHKLSKERADAVAAWLIQHGVDASRIETVGYGEEYPKTANADDAAREQNRRVEFHVVQLNGQAFGDPRPDIKLAVADAKGDKANANAKAEKKDAKTAKKPAK